MDLQKGQIFADEKRFSRVHPQSPRPLKFDLGGMKMTIWYSKDRMYRVDEFDNDTRFLLKRSYKNDKGEPVYEVVCQLKKEEMS